MKKVLEDKVFTIFLLAFGVFAMLRISLYLTDNTFSRYRSSGSGETAVETAVPIVDNTIEEITIPLSTMVPGSVNAYAFSVKNFDSSNKVTEVNMNYNIQIEGTNYLPLEYTLTKNLSSVTLTNGLTPWNLLPHTNPTTDNYVLTITWPSEQDVFNYANLVEVITITINAIQKVD